MDLDLSRNNSSSSHNTSSVSTSSSANTSVASTFTKASSVASSSKLVSSKSASTSATGIAKKRPQPPASPPRAPEPFKLPSVTAKSAILSGKSFPSSESLPPAATQVVNIPSLPRVVPKAASNAESRASSVDSLSSRALKAPFTAKTKKDANQSKLSGFFESTSDDKKRVCPWDEAAAGPSKVPRGASADPSEGGKGKGKSRSKDTGIGPLNVKQQIVLSQEQQKVLKMVDVERKSVFFTGSAGELITSNRLVSPTGTTRG